MPSLSWSHGCLGLVLAGALCGLPTSVQAQVVPGTGNLLNYDDMEDVNWGYVHNFPKSSKEEDENIRYPLGASNNRMWSESPKRGAPDVVRRCETPAGGLPGSTGSLYLRTRDSGIPGRPGNKQAQDDFILSARPVAVGYSPNYVVRVYLPEFKDWEQRQGVSFGIRAGLQGMMTKEKPASVGRRLFSGSKTRTVTEMEPYYPGFFVAFNPVSANPAFKEDHAQILIRSDGNGHEVAGPKITQTGWWTFGMSVTPDSRCHYYAHAGIADLTAGDHIYSSLPYGIRGEHFNTIFFNVCSADNASSWSTPWIIDDPKVYYSGQPVFKPAAPQQAQQPQPLKTAEATTAAPNAQNASMSKEIPATPAAQVPMPNGIPLTPPVTPPATTPEVTPPAQVPAATAPPVAAPAAVPSTPPAAVPAPAPPSAAPQTAPLSIPMPMPTTPALLSTGPTVSLKPVPPLLAPTSTTAGETSPSPAPSAPLLVPPVASSATSPPTGKEAAVIPATVDTSKPAEELKGNPFDNPQTQNSPSPAAAPASETPVTTPEQPQTSAPVTPPQDEPPLVISGASEPSTQVDSTPVPPPPAE